MARNYIRKNYLPPVYYKINTYYDLSREKKSYACHLAGDKAKAREYYDFNEIKLLPNSELGAKMRNPTVFFLQVPQT